MVNKFISAALAVCMSVALVAAASPPPNQELISYKVAVQFCRAAYNDYKTTGKLDMLHGGMAQLSKVNQSFTAYTCAAYAEGFEDGENARISVT